MTNAPGRKHILVTSILLIVLNAFLTLLHILTLLSIDFWLPVYGGEALRGIWILITMAGILLSLFFVAVGILGVIFCGRIDRAGMLIGFGSATVATTIVFNAASAMFSSNNFGESVYFEIIFTMAVLVLPILYIVGAVKNKKAADFADQYGGFL